MKEIIEVYREQKQKEYIEKMGIIDEGKIVNDDDLCGDD